MWSAADFSISSINLSFDYMNGKERKTPPQKVKITTKEIFIPE